MDSPGTARGLPTSRAPAPWSTVLAPLAILVALSPWLGICCWNYCKGLLNRDAMMFLYASWSVLHGERLYSTISIPDGPFPCLLHMLFLLGGGMDDHRFRVLDLLLHFSGAFAAGAVLVPPRAPRLLVSRLVWGLVFATLWLAVLFHWGFVDANQRENYYSLLDCLGFALVIASGERAPRRARVMLITAGVLLCLPVFGKQTTVVYPLLALGGLALEPRSPELPRWQRWPRWQEVRWLLAGLMAAAAVMLLSVVVMGSARGYLFWQFDYSLHYYPYFERHPMLEVVQQTPKDLSTLAVACLVGGALGVGRGLLPRRALGFAAASFVALAIATVQSKFFTGYQIPTLELGQGFLAYLVVRAWHGAQASRDRQTAYAVAVALAALVVVRALDWVQNSAWMDKATRTDTAPPMIATRDAAQWLHDHIGEDERVFYFGNEPGIPLLAERRPASPFFVEWLTATRISLETPALARARIEAMHRTLGRQLCDGFQAKHPPAVALSDSWCLAGDCLTELAEMCPAIPDVLKAEYFEPKVFGSNRIWVQKPLP
jgi:hypothetical protein